MSEQGTLFQNDAQLPPATTKSRIKSIVLVGGILLLPFLALMLIWHDRCPRTSLQTLTSPDGTMVVEQIAVDCGKRMRPATEVLLRKVQGGKVIDDATVLIIPSNEKLPITWNSNTNIAIRLPGSQSQVVKYRRAWSGVQIALIGEVISSTPKNIEDF